MAEQFPRKEQVVSSNLITSSRKRRYHQISLFFMIINLGIGPERVAAYKKQYSILFLAARAERPKRGQSVCKAQSAAADGDSHRKLHFCLYYLPTAQLAALAALHHSGHLRILPQLCCVCTANRQAVPFSHSRQFPHKEQVESSNLIASSIFIYNTCQLLLIHCNVKSAVCHPERVKRAEGSLLCKSLQCNYFLYMFSAKILHSLCSFRMTLGLANAWSCRLFMHK